MREGAHSYVLVKVAGEETKEKNSYLKRRGFRFFAGKKQGEVVVCSQKRIFPDEALDGALA